MFAISIRGEKELSLQRICIRVERIGYFFVVFPSILGYDFLRSFTRSCTYFRTLRMPLITIYRVGYGNINRSMSNYVSLKRQQQVPAYRIHRTITKRGKDQVRRNTPVYDI